MPEELETIEFDDQALFDEANADEPASPEPVAAEAEPEKSAEQLRDDAGRWTAKEEPEVPAITAEKPVVDDNAPQVPSWRVREINEEKRQLAEQKTALETEKSEWQREQQDLRQRLAALEKPPQPKVEAVKPDPLLDPEGFEKHIRNELREELLNDRRETSLQSAHRTYKGEFEEAYAAAQKGVDPALKALMQQSRDPGETLMQWHREQKTRAEVGTDLNAFREREAERLLNDPAFVAKAIEKARGSAQTVDASGRPHVKIAPSLSSMTRATNAPSSESDDDLSDDALWNHANA